MMIYEVIKIFTGIIMLKKTKFGEYIVAAWLTGIALTLIAGFNFVDLAVLGLVGAIPAFSTARIT